MKNLFFILLFFLATNKMYSQTVAPLLANDTFKLEACAQGPIIPGENRIERCNIVDLSGIGENEGFIKSCGNISLINQPATLFKSLSTTGTPASFRIVNLSKTATLKISITLIGQASLTINIAPNSKSEIINAINIKLITASIFCTNSLGILNEKAVGLFQWIK